MLTFPKTLSYVANFYSQKAAEIAEVAACLTAKAAELVNNVPAAVETGLSRLLPDRKPNQQKKSILDQILKSSLMEFPIKMLNQQMIIPHEIQLQN